MTHAKKLDQGLWPKFMDTFSSDNMGRRVTVAIQDSSAREQTLADRVALFAVDYDPVGKGDDLVISLGDNDIESTHEINEPVTIWEILDEDDTIVSLEILDQKENKTRITFDS
jgi:hypothetical protein